MKDDFYGKAYYVTKGSEGLIWTSQNRAYKDTEIWTFFFSPIPSAISAARISFTGKGEDYIWPENDKLLK